VRQIVPSFKRVDKADINGGLGEGALGRKGEATAVVVKTLNPVYIDAAREACISRKRRWVDGESAAESVFWPISAKV